MIMLNNIKIERWVTVAELSFAQYSREKKAKIIGALNKSGKAAVNSCCVFRNSDRFAKYKTKVLD